MSKKYTFSIYRYNPKTDSKPFMQDFTLQVDKNSRRMTLLDALCELKSQDPSLNFRCSCREGVCGSDAINVNGKNKLACITSLSDYKSKIVLRPLPGLPVIRDLVVDLTQFFEQYKKIKPYLINNNNASNRENTQLPEERAKLDGLYECILCACCSTACPSFWWNPDKFIGPAGLLAAYRFISDSRDTEKQDRIENLKDAYSLFRCHGIMNCVQSCPKGLNPTKAIARIRTMILEDD